MGPSRFRKDQRKGDQIHVKGILPLDSRHMRLGNDSCNQLLLRMPMIFIDTLWWPTKAGDSQRDQRTRFLTSANLHRCIR